MEILFIGELSYNQSLSYLLSLAHLPFVKKIHCMSQERYAPMPKVCYHVVRPFSGAIRLRSLSFLVKSSFLLFNRPIRFIIIKPESFFPCLLFCFLKFFFRRRFVACLLIYRYFFECDPSQNTQKTFVFPLFVKMMNVLLNHFFVKMMNVLLNHFDVISTVTEKNRPYLCQRGVHKPIFLRPAFIDTHRFQPIISPFSRTDFSKEIYHCMTVSQYIPRKNIFVFLKLVARLKQNLGDSFRALLLGDGPLKNSLLSYSQLFNLTPFVDFIDYTPQVEFYYPRARLFILPSLNEGVSVATAEAMACAVPAIAFNVGGMDELIRDGVNGYLIPPFDETLLFEKAFYLLTHEEVRRDMGEKARQTVQTLFSLERAQQEWGNIFRYMNLVKK